MKKLRFISMMCLLALFVVSLTGCKKEGNNTKTGYVDLGLPSGTKWKASNETKGNGDVYYTYDEAVSTFGDKLPTKEQFDELLVYCTWEYQNNGGYKVTGANGNSIVLPAAGFRFCEGDVGAVGVYGLYWSSTPNGSEGAWHLNLIYGSADVEMGSGPRCYGYAVRLVKD